MTAGKFKMSLKGDVTFVTVEKALNKMGYIVIFFNTPEGDREIERYKLNKKTNLKSFTYSKGVKIIFINGNLSSEEMLCMLLHEAGHICCGHIGDGKVMTRSKVYMDIEADAFAYKVIKRKQSKFPDSIKTMILIILIIIFSSRFNGQISIQVNTIPQNVISEQRK